MGDCEVRGFRVFIKWLLNRWRVTGWHGKFLIAVLYIFGLLIPISRQLTDIPIDWRLIFILSVLYFAVCIISLFTEKSGNENRDMHILLIGAFIAFIFSVSLSPDHDSNVITLISIAVRLEVLLLAIGVPLVFNATIIKKNPGKHLEAIRLLKRFVYLSLFVIVLFLFQLSIFDEDVTRSHIFLGIISINDISIISISIFLFIYSTFYFIHIIIKSIDIFLKDVGELKQKQKLKDSIRKGDEESIKKHCDNLDGKDIVDVMRGMIGKEIDKADDALLGGMYHLLKLNCADLKEHPETSISIKLLWYKVKDAQGENAEEIKSLLRKEFPEITKHNRTRV